MIIQVFETTEDNMKNGTLSVMTTSQNFKCGGNKQNSSFFSVEINWIMSCFQYHHYSLVEGQKDLCDAEDVVFSS